MCPPLSIDIGRMVESCMSSSLVGCPIFIMVGGCMSSTPYSYYGGGFSVSSNLYSYGGGVQCVLRSLLCVFYYL